MTGSEALVRGARFLRDAGVADAPGDARRLLAFALGIAPTRLTVDLPLQLPPGMSEAYDELLLRRAKRIPVSQIVGERMFWGRNFLVSAAVLDPRPETEILVAAALEEPFERVLDLGTGSGCILLTLLAECGVATGVGIDLSNRALRVAERNMLRLGLGLRVALRQGDWLAPVEGDFDLIVSNPPYIAAAEMPDLEPEVREHEPRLALTDEGDGLGAYRAILVGARSHLRQGGRLILEHGPGQADSIAAIGQAQGWAPPEHRRDLDGRIRAILFRAP